MFRGLIGRAAVLAAATAGCLALAAGGASAQQTVAQIKQRGMLNCGVDTGIPGFAYQDTAGKWIGFDVDYC
jgi:general L-amino acid transport system substrate-binding protein